MNNVDHNLIIANYGASQGFDTDDGSSWYNITNNFFFLADGWKMDYGGHDSFFNDNLVSRPFPSWNRSMLTEIYLCHACSCQEILRTETAGQVYHGTNDGQNCVNVWPFLAKHGAEWKRNKCIIPRSRNGGEISLSGSISGCNCPGPNVVTPWNASDLDSRPPTECGVAFADNEYFTPNGSATFNRCGDFEADWKGKNEPSSTISVLPSDEELLTWARAKLAMPAAPTELSL
jgi:hypothetical protein